MSTEKTFTVGLCANTRTKVVVRMADAEGEMNAILSPKEARALALAMLEVAACTDEETVQ